MATFYYRKDSGFIWEKISEPTEQEQKHLACVVDVVWWGQIEISDTATINHVRKGRCVCVDDVVSVIPESEWPENQGVEE